MTFVARLIAIALSLPLVAQAQTLTVREGGTVVLPAPALVEYGVRDKWHRRIMSSGTLRCGNALFDDPYPGWGKSCKAHLINTSSCLPRIMGGAGVSELHGVGVSGPWYTYWCPASDGPRLRVLAGTWGGAYLGVTCITRTPGPLADALKTCAPDDVTSPELVYVWSGNKGAIAESKP